MSPHKLYPNSQLFTEHLPWARHWVRCGLRTDKEVTRQGNKHFVSLEDRANCLGSLCVSHVLSDSTNPSLCKDFDEIYPQLGTSDAHLGVSPESSQGIAPPAFATVVCHPSLPKATTSWTLDSTVTPCRTPAGTRTLRGFRGCVDPPLHSGHRLCLLSCLFPILH